MGFRLHGVASPSLGLFSLYNSAVGLFCLSVEKKAKEREQDCREMMLGQQRDYHADSEGGEQEEHMGMLRNKVRKRPTPRCLLPQNFGCFPEHGDRVA